MTIVMRRRRGAKKKRSEETPSVGDPIGLPNPNLLTSLHRLALEFAEEETIECPLPAQDPAPWASCRSSFPNLSVWDGLKTTFFQLRVVT